MELAVGVVLLGVLVAAKRDPENILAVNQYPPAAASLHTKFDTLISNNGRGRSPAIRGWGTGDKGRLTASEWLKVYSPKQPGLAQWLLQQRLPDPGQYEHYKDILFFFEEQNCPALLMGPSVRDFLKDWNRVDFNNQRQPIKLDFVPVCKGERDQHSLNKKLTKLISDANFVRLPRNVRGEPATREQPTIFFPSDLLQNTEHFRWSVDAVMLSITAGASGAGPSSVNEQILAFGDHSMTDMNAGILRPMHMQTDSWDGSWDWVRTRTSASSWDLLHTDYLRMLMKDWQPVTPCFRYFMQNFLVMQADAEHEKEGNEFRGSWCEKVLNTANETLNEQVPGEQQLPATHAGLVHWAKGLHDKNLFDRSTFMKIYMGQLKSYFETDGNICRDTNTKLEAKRWCMKKGHRDALAHAKSIVVLGAYGICFAEEIGHAIVHGCEALDYTDTFLRWFDSDRS